MLWIKKLKEKLLIKFKLFMISIKNTEDITLTQKGSSSHGEQNQVIPHKQNDLMNDLLKEEVTEEVKKFRARYYKVIEHVDEIDVNIDFDVLYEKNELKYSKINKNKNYKKRLFKKVKLDDYDDYELEMVIPNHKYSLDLTDAIDSSNDLSIDIIDHSNNKEITLIDINFDFLPKFNLGDFLVKINVRNIDNNSKLLELYFDKYCDDINKKKKLFTSELKRILNNNKYKSLFDIKSIEFVTNKCIGVKDGLYFKYDDIKFDKIIEFDGFYVVKFKCKPKINGESIFSKYKHEEIEKGYKDKKPRDNKYKTEKS